MDRLLLSSFSMALLSLLYFSQCNISQATPYPTPNTPRESILQCLLRRSVPRSLFLFPQSGNFTTAYLSPFQNQRVILDALSVKPLLIITPTHESHAQAAVFCARLLNLQIRTRSGGHDYEGLSYSSTFGPFLMLDLTNLRSISLDLSGSQKTAWVQAGATLGELYYAIASKSSTLAFPAGFCPTICVGGHISGGGVGTIMRAHGVAVDQLVDVRIINANGQVIQRESMGEDLFWAVRGGGGASFGVIISYKIKLVEIPPKVTVFSKALTLSQGATKAIAQWQQVAYRADNRLYISATLSFANKTVKVTFSSLFLGEMAELLPIMSQTLPDLQVSGKDFKEMSWIESLVVFSFFPLPNINGGPLTRLLDRSPLVQNFSFKIKSDIVTEPITERSWEKIWKYFINGDGTPAIVIEPLGGKIAEIAETATPFPHRNGSKFVIQYLELWPDAGEKVSRKHIDWSRKFYDFMAPFVSKNPRAAYLNFRDLDLGKNRAGLMSYNDAKVWGEKYYKMNFKRLAMAKSETDGENFFRNEQSIPPLSWRKL